MKKIDFSKLYLFCHICGDRLEREGDNLMVCAQGHHNYINPKVTNGVIFENLLGQIMLVRRKYPPFEGKWDLPGGFVDPCENMEESVRREINEELGIDIENLSYFTSKYDFYEYQNVIYPTICII